MKILDLGFNNKVVINDKDLFRIPTHLAKYLRHHFLGETANNYADIQFLETIFLKKSKKKETLSKIHFRVIISEI